ncbi:MAG: glycosyltransferase family 4 protein [Alistipes sp.]|nr:glycosyltransferase family 4 protein [Alistipes sp.]
MPKLLRLTTVDISLDALLKGQLRYLSHHFEVVAVAADTGVLAQVGEREGVRTVAVPMHREISLWADCKSLWALIRLFRRERPDIVHVNTPKASLLGMVAAALCRVPHRIYLVTGLRFETTHGLLRLVLKTMERIACLCATKVVPEGDGVKATLVRERITRKPMQKVLNGNINGIDLCWYDRTPEVEQRADEVRGDSSDFTFVFIGRMVGDKGLNELVEAFDRLSAEREDVRLRLVGRFEEELDPLPAHTKQRIRQNPKVEEAGYQSDVRPYLAASDVLVLPSYREGFPNVILQAGAMGLPVIVTDVNGSDEVIEQGVNGVIVPRRDAEALYGAMAQMAAERKRTAQMASVARKMVAERFDQRDVWAAIAQMYKRELGDDV